MKQLNKFLLFVFSVVIITIICLTSGCKNCPDDIQLGDLHFTNPNFFPFRGGETYTFINQHGDELVFDSAVNQSMILDIMVETLCRNGWNGTIFGSLQSSYYTAPAYDFVYYLNDKISLRYAFNISEDQSVHRADTVLFELFHASFDNIESEQPTNELYYIVSDRGNSLTPETRNQYPMTRIISDTTINGNHYTNLYCNKQSPELFYSTLYGIVLFRHRDDWWYLKF